MISQASAIFSVIWRFFIEIIIYLGTHQAFFITS